jgi:hypothetical protein
MDIGMNMCAGEWRDKGKEKDIDVRGGKVG